jgi:hypothetical protein
VGHCQTNQFNIRKEFVSDIYESTALTFQLPNKEAQAYALDFYRRVRNAFDEVDQFSIGLEPLPDIPAEFQNEEIYLGWLFEVEADGERGLYIAAVDGTAEFQHAVATFIQHLLRKFDPCGYVQFEWSRTCSRPLPTCFSGGAAHITAQEILLFSTLNWLEERSQGEKERRVNRTYADGQGAGGLNA